MAEQAGIRENVPLAPFTSIKVGGPADAVAVCTSFAGVTEALRWAADRNAPTSARNCAGDSTLRGVNAGSATSRSKRITPPTPVTAMSSSTALQSSA